MNIYEVSVIVAVLTFMVIAVFMVRALIQIKKTAQSMEHLSKMTAENVEKTRSTFELLDSVASLLDSTFYRALKLGLNIFQYSRSRKKPE